LSACPSIMSISARRTAHDPPVTVFIFFPSRRLSQLTALSSAVLTRRRPYRIPSRKSFCSVAV
jgi:hypothetical protein